VLTTRYPGKELDGAPLPDDAADDVVRGFWLDDWVPALCADPGDAVCEFWWEDWGPASCVDADDERGPAAAAACSGAAPSAAAAASPMSQ
jgi:hypothetical protein